jgi:hypothetical protein
LYLTVFNSFIIAINTTGRQTNLDVEQSHSPVHEHQGAGLAVTVVVLSPGFLWSGPQEKALQEHSACHTFIRMIMKSGL